MCLFFICYFYQFVYMAVSLFHKEIPHKPEILHRIAVLIAARNEQAVIGNLLDSLHAQNYPEQYFDIYVGADNCTDDTAAIAKAHGAIVFERSNLYQIGKGYVLNHLLKRIAQSGKKYDAYLVLDADNVLESDFVREINRTFSDGYDIVTSYRNSKNYGDNWISAGYALWALREARYLNAARMAVGASGAVSGTGFLFSDRILQKCGGWNFYLLTEDIEFTVDNIVRGEKIGYAAKAVLYDEQPTRFTQSWHQRLRWSKGYLQVFKKYGRRLFCGIFHGSFSCYDMMMTIMPAAVLTLSSIIVNFSAAICRLITADPLDALGCFLLQTANGLYVMLLVLGIVTTVSEWHNIHCHTWKKILYTFTFPLFMLTYIPICIAALFSKVNWTPIRHEQSLTLEQIKDGWYSGTARQASGTIPSKTVISRIHTDCL